VQLQVLGGRPLLLLLLLLLLWMLVLVLPGRPRAKIRSWAARDGAGGGYCAGARPGASPAPT
jgi:hypothetical protein